MHKKLNIFLFVLIVLGLILIFTQKSWLPKLVNKIISSEPTKTQVNTKNEQKNVVLVDGRQCYVYSHDKTKTEPYAINEFLDITISGAKVTGTKKGTQSGTDMTNGYTGTITGTLNNEIINDVFAYTIEGSKNKEGEIYAAGKTGIEKLRYPLMERGDMLVPDTTKTYTALKYNRVECTASN